MSAPASASASAASAPAHPPRVFLARTRGPAREIKWCFAWRHVTSMWVEGSDLVIYFTGGTPSRSTFATEEKAREALVEHMRLIEALNRGE